MWRSEFQARKLRYRSSCAEKISPGLVKIVPLLLQECETLEECKKSAQAVSLILQRPDGLIKVEGDGDCFYHAIVSAIAGEKQSEIVGKGLRQQFAKYLKTQDMTLESVKAALTRVEGNEWAESEEILLMSKFKGSCIVVHSSLDNGVPQVFINGSEPYGPTVVRECCNGSNTVIHLLNANNNHYDAYPITSPE